MQFNLNNINITLKKCMEDYKTGHEYKKKKKGKRSQILKR